MRENVRVGEVEVAGWHEESLEAAEGGCDGLEVVEEDAVE